MKNFKKGIVVAMMCLLPAFNAFAADIKTSNHDAFKLECTACHESSVPGENMTSTPCIKCHGDFDKVVSLTANKFEANPHDPHSPTVTCLSCHRAHSPGVDSCSERCHSFDFKVK